MPIKFGDELTKPCRICKKVWKHRETDKYYYLDGIFVCSHHPGVKEWWESNLKEANEQLIKDGILLV